MSYFLKNKPLPRRTFLRGSGAAIGLPILEIMMPVKGFSQGLDLNPCRFASLVFPYGTYQDSLSPIGGKTSDLPEPYRALEPFTNDFSFLTGIRNHHGFANNDGPGDHARALGTYLTCSRLRKTRDGNQIQAGKSMDQTIADQFVGITPIKNIYIKLQGTDGEDSGYSSLYKNLSWVNQSTPETAIRGPAELFQILFSGGLGAASQKAQQERNLARKSILDAVKEDLSQLKDKLGATDKASLDAWLTSLREVEKGIAAGSSVTCDIPSVPEVGDYNRNLGNMLNLVAMAFACDITRVAVISMGSGSQGGHHSDSHHNGDSKKIQNLLASNKSYANHFANFLGKLSTTKSQDKSMLDQSIVTFGSGLRDGNAHDNNNLPLILAGKGGGTLNPGRVINNDKAELSSLWLGLMQKMGVSKSEFGGGFSRSLAPLAGL